MNFRFEVSGVTLVWEDHCEMSRDPLGLRIVDSSSFLDPLAVLLIETWIRDDGKFHLASSRRLTLGIPERLDDQFLALMGDSRPSKPPLMVIALNPADSSSRRISDG